MEHYARLVVLVIELEHYARLVILVGSQFEINQGISTVGVSHIHIASFLL